MVQVSETETDVTSNLTREPVAHAASVCRVIDPKTGLVVATIDPVTRKRTLVRSVKAACAAPPVGAIKSPPAPARQDFDFVALRAELVQWLREADSMLDLRSREFRAALLLASACVVGHDLGVLVRATGFPEGFVAEVRRRLFDQRVWERMDGTYLFRVLWLDEVCPAGKSWMSFWADVLVATGAADRVYPADPEAEWLYQYAYRIYRPGAPRPTSRPTGIQITNSQYVKQATHRQRCRTEGRCWHCGRACAPYYECDDRRRYRRRRTYEARHRAGA